MKKGLILAMSLLVVAALSFSCSGITGRTAGQHLDDMSVTGAVKAKLIKDDRLSAFKIDVDSFQGNVTLTGAVPSKEAEERAVQLARETSGVRSVKSNLQIAGSTATTGAPRRE